MVVRRTNRYVRFSVSINKNTHLIEKMDLQVKCEMLNAFTPCLRVPSGTPTDNLFGMPTTTPTTARNSQIAARIRF